MKLYAVAQSPIDLYYNPPSTPITTPKDSQNKTESESPAPELKRTDSSGHADMVSRLQAQVIQPASLKGAFRAEIAKLEKLMNNIDKLGPVETWYNGEDGNEEWVSDIGDQGIKDNIEKLRTAMKNYEPVFDQVTSSQDIDLMRMASMKGRLLRYEISLIVDDLKIAAGAKFKWQSSREEVDLSAFSLSKCILAEIDSFDASQTEQLLKRLDSDIEKHKDRNTSGDHLQKEYLEYEPSETHYSYTNWGRWRD